MINEFWFFYFYKQNQELKNSRNRTSLRSTLKSEDSPNIQQL